MEKYILKTEEQIFTVSDITRNIRWLLEENFAQIAIQGEVSNFKKYSSGHLYFSLKDEEAQIQCVMFRRENSALNFDLEDGLEVICFGRISVYPVRGQYQLYVTGAEPKGLGALQLKFQQLKDKLLKEGLFDEGFKKPIPYLPSTVGIVTSIDGAALHDILKVLHRRFSTLKTLIYPVQVQGSGAAPAIVEAIEDLNRTKLVDVMIVGRGGGSLEDLWAFNEEEVARAIFESEIPVVSAVGHEVDFTIADFVADLRAPTPSVAAELVAPLKEELVLRAQELKMRMTSAFLAQIKFLRQELKNLKDSPGIKNPLGFFEVKFQRLDELKKNLMSVFENVLSLKKEKFLGFIGKLEALGPLATLRRGFSVSLKLPSEKIVTSASSLKEGDRIKTRLFNGFFVSVVDKIEN